MPDESDLLTTAEVAEQTGVDVATVNRWAAKGRLPVALKLPGLRGANLFDPATVDHVVTAPGPDAA